jgi:hypothetical protein
MALKFLRAHAVATGCSRRLSMEMDGAGTAGLLGDGVL